MKATTRFPKEVDGLVHISKESHILEPKQVKSDTEGNMLVLIISNTPLIPTHLTMITQKLGIY